MPIEALAPNGHLGLVEGVLHDIIRVELVVAAHDVLEVRLLGLREQEELGPREGLKAGEAEEGRFQDLEAGEGGARHCGGEGGGGEGAGYGVDAVEVGKESHFRVVFI